jgi:hypothetical protein
VTREEALAELGLDPDSDADSTRRAYLRLIKERRPESDPEGFQRAREAYEIARAAAAFEAFAAQSAHHLPDAAGGTSNDGRRTDNPPSDSGRDTTAYPPEANLSPADTAFAGFIRTWEAVPAFSDPEARIKIARDAVAALPRDPRTHWLLVSTLADYGREHELAEALRAAYREGWPEFLQALLVRLPAKATREEVDTALASRGMALQLAGAGVAVRWDPARAAATVGQICRLADSLPENEIPIDGLLDVTLALYEAGALDAATTAHTALRACVRERDLELALARSPLGGVWMMAEEISVLPADFSSSLRRALAAGARAGDLTSAFYDACFEVRQNARRVRRWSKRIRPRAPNIAGTLAAAIARERENSHNLARFRLGQLGYLAVVPVLLAVIRACTSSHGPSNAVDGTATMPSVRWEAPARTQMRATSLHMVDSVASELCQGAESPPIRLPCPKVGELVTSLETADCRGVDSLLRELREHASKSALSEIETRFLTRVDLAAWQVCSSTRRTGAAGTGP